MIVAAVMQWVIIAHEILLIAIAVAVIFASFYDRTPNYKGWLASIIAAIIIASSVGTIIETTTSIRNEGQSYGWPMGRDHRSFGRFGHFNFVLDRLMDNAVIHKLEMTITTIHNTDNNSLPTGIEPLDQQEMSQLCRHLFFINHPLFDGLTITTTNEDGITRGLYIQKSDCERWSQIARLIHCQMVHHSVEQPIIIRLVIMGFIIMRFSYRLVLIAGKNAIPLIWLFTDAPLAVYKNKYQAPVAQLDRALPSEGRGQRFESSRVRHLPCKTSLISEACPSIDASAEEAFPDASS